LATMPPSGEANQAPLPQHARSELWTAIDFDPS